MVEEYIDKVKVISAICEPEDDAVSDVYTVEISIPDGMIFKYSRLIGIKKFPDPVEFVQGTDLINRLYKTEDARRKQYKVGYLSDALDDLHKNIRATFKRKRNGTTIFEVSEIPEYDTNADSNQN